MAAAKKVNSKIKKNVTLSLIDGPISLNDLQAFIDEAKALGVDMDANLINDYDGEMLTAST